MKYKIYRFLSEKSLSKNSILIKKELKLFLSFMEANGSQIKDFLVDKYKINHDKAALGSRNGSISKVFSGKEGSNALSDWRESLWSSMAGKRDAEKQSELLKGLVEFGSVIAKRPTSDNKMMALAVFQLAQYQYTQRKDSTTPPTYLLDSKFEEAQIISVGVPGILPSNRSFALKVAESLALKKHAASLYVMGLNSLKLGNVKKAIDYIKEASDNGNSQAEYHMATLYQTGISGTFIKKDPRKARGYALQAHENGNLAGTFLLSQFYTTGYGSENGKPEKEKAFDLTKIAAEEGGPIAQHNLAQMYIEKIEKQSQLSEKPKKTNGIINDILFAIEYYKMAAEQKFTPSLVALGMIYESGYPTGNIASDKFLAKRYYEKATASFSRKEFASYVSDAKAGLQRLEL